MKVEKITLRNRQTDRKRINLCMQLRNTGVTRSNPQTKERAKIRIVVIVNLLFSE